MIDRYLLVYMPNNLKCKYIELHKAWANILRSGAAQFRQTEVRGSNLVISNLGILNICLLSAALKRQQKRKKRPGMTHFKNILL